MRGRTETGGKGGTPGSCHRDVMYERRIKKKIKIVYLNIDYTPGLAFLYASLAN